MKTLIDTNILVRAHHSHSSYQKSAAGIIRDDLEGRFDAVVSIQNIVATMEHFWRKDDLHRKYSRFPQVVIS